MIVEQVLAEGIEKVVVVTDEPRQVSRRRHPAGRPGPPPPRPAEPAEGAARGRRASPCCVYDQTCAAEKRRRRKRGLFPDPDKRVFINPAVCEGCGDCGVKSNCVAVVAAGDRARHQARHRPVGVQQGFLLPQRLLPELRHGARRQGEEGRASRVGDSGIASMLASLPEPKLPVARPALHHAGDGRRRHGRRDALGRARPGGAPRRQGLRRHRHDGPGAEGRRGRLPHARRQVGRPDPRHPRRRGRRRPRARLRPGGDGLQQGAGDHQARPHGGGLLRLRDVDGRLHAQRQPQGARRGAAACHRGAGRQGARARTSTRTRRP